MNLGTVFSGNAPAPLQQEIQAHLNITDSQFNSFYSIKACSAMILPFLIAILYERIGLTYMLLTAGVTNGIGTYLFALGLSFSHYNTCLLGRMFIGLGDAGVFAQTVICTWFPIQDIAWAASWKMCLSKMVRTCSDKMGPMVYNMTNDIVSFYWIAFGVALASIGCQFALLRLIKDKKTSEKKKEANPDSIVETLKKLPFSYYLFLIVTGLTYAGIHGFYPNLSKFFQQRFNYNNEEAASITAAPYLLGSIVTPLCGSLLSKLGPNHFEKIIMIAVIALLSVHLVYSQIANGEGNIYCVIPILVFGMSHSLFSTCHSPMVRKLIVDSDKLPFCFSMM